MKIVTVIGARPQFIKAAPVSQAIHRYNLQATPPRGPITEVLVHTGQHYDEEMSAIFFQELKIPNPDYDLGVGSGTHAYQTGVMLQRVEEVLLKEKPDLVIVYGDTNSTLAGALASAKLHIPVAHVEAGLRSFNKRMPEEINRVLTDHVSTLLFCPTETAVKNLDREGITQGVSLVGDVMYELLNHYAAAAPRARLLGRLSFQPREYALATIHRAENTDDAERLAGIFKALSTLSMRLPVICPLHPRARAVLDDLSLDFPPSLHIVEPVSYLEMLALERDARLVLTDSGGVQKEAFWLGVPCVTVRDETEWVETLADGRNRLAGSDAERIYAVALVALASPRFAPPVVRPIGAAKAIIACLANGQFHETRK